MVTWRLLVTGFTLAATAGAAFVVGDRFAPRVVPWHEAASRSSPVDGATVAPSARAEASTPADASAPPGTTTLPRASTPPAAPTASLSAVLSEPEQRQRNEAALTAALQRYDDGTYADLALSVVDRRTGRMFSYRGQQPFDGGGIVTVDILATLLLQVQDPHRSLTAPERSLARAMIETGDHDAATALWNRTGGISRSVDVFGLNATVPGGHGRWEATTTTAEDQARLVSALADPAGPVANAEYLFGLMRAVTHSRSWGVSAAVRAGEAAAVTNGWTADSGDNGRWAVHSVGRITGPDTDVTVVVLSRGNASLRAGIDLVEAVARLARAYLEW